MPGLAARGHGRLRMTEGLPQLDEDGLNGDSDESNVQGEIISAEPHKGNAE